MHVLVIRLSAMGDVAMTVPVLLEALEQNPDLELTVLSKRPFQYFFPVSNRLHFEAIDTKDAHKGFFGLYKKFKELTGKYQFRAVADFHNVLRSNVLSSFFRMSGKRVASIEKGRAGKRQLTRKENKVSKADKHSSVRYADVLRQLGLRLKFEPTETKEYLKNDEKALLELNTFNVGFAPFAQHEGKAYPFEKCREVIHELAKNKKVNVFLFGGGKKESDLLKKLESDNVFSLAGKFLLPQELAQIAKLNVMVSMDSANMHIASLFGVRTISIWGATHYLAGFLGIGQKAEDIIEIPPDELACRPCSVFGNKPCFRGDYACLHKIDSNRIVDKIHGALNG